MYTYIKKSPFSFDETLDELRIAFSQKGFWVVSNIDISKKIREKVNPNFWLYTNLGFCKPELANKYLSEDINIWVFMPCNISVYEQYWDIYISAWLPENIISKVIKNKNLNSLSSEISKTMKEIVDSI